ncbi:MAG: RNA polymerase sigma factor [Planctomycetota bacterium]|jgi:RNA polymerase sigma-70 factor (ECF subfamily)
MSKPGQTDTRLLEAIRRGDAETWSKLINKYQGRLLRYAMTRVAQRADAEDVVQNTFTSFIEAIDNLKIEVSLETYLFGILRNEIVNRFRVQGARKVCLIQDIYHKDSRNVSGDAIAYVGASDPSTSWCVSHDEEHGLLRQALARAIGRFVRTFQKAHKLESLKMAELMFYCQLSNKDVARQLSMETGQVRTFKHRSLKRIRRDVAQRYSAKDITISYSEDLLTAIWEEHRLSCIKRSTLSAFLLEDLPPEWFDYVDFHLTTMGCHFCRASFKDLQAEQAGKRQDHLRHRILASTVGFLPRP